MRPLTDDQKTKRQDDLAAQALGILLTTGYPKLTVDAVAKAAGVAKGTVFLAFDSKEELVLHGVRRRFENWISRLKTLEPTGFEPRVLAQKVLETLRADPGFLPLAALVGPVLEVGCGRQAVLGFKRALASGLADLDRFWTSMMPNRPPGSLVPFFLGIYALMVGAWSVSETSEAVRDALEGQPDLAVFRIRFEELFLPLLETQLEALAASGPRGANHDL